MAFQDDETLIQPIFHEQYEEDGMIWFRIFDTEIGRYVMSGDRELELTQTIHDAKYTVDVYTNHLFLPKDYK